MSIGLTKSGFWAIRIPNINDRYPSAFRYVACSACHGRCSNTSFLRLNFFFIPTCKSKVVKLFDTIMRWVGGSQLHIVIFCKIEYLEVRWEERIRNLYGHNKTFPPVITETTWFISSTSFSSSFGTSVHS